MKNGAGRQQLMTLCNTQQVDKIICQDHRVVTDELCPDEWSPRAECCMDSLNLPAALFIFHQSMVFVLQLPFSSEPIVLTVLISTEITVHIFRTFRNANGCFTFCIQEFDYKTLSNMYIDVSILQEDSIVPSLD